ncbi:hypothetical protein ACI3KY_12020 [Microbacterium sp. ZW T2_14]|uniref:hypothetical protein n=1 Tax=Microbacterium sp. ZW T2_14 TaxID=3378079 RepID=UPI00385381E3
MSFWVSTPPAMRLTDAVARVARRLGADGIGVERLDDDQLLELLSDTTEARKALELVVASASAEVSRRSGRDRGYGGLAQRRGLRTGTALVQQITGLGRGDVARAVRAGEELAPTVAVSAEPVGSGADAAPQTAVAPPPEVPEWLQLVRGALAAGALSQAQFHAIRSGLGEPPVEHYPELDAEFLPQAWTRAVRLLLDEAATLAVEDLRHQARIARDRLDPVGVTLRFEERFAALLPPVDRRERSVPRPHPVRR